MWYIYSRYLNSTLCSWIINLNYLVVSFTNAAPQFPWKLVPFIHALLIKIPTAGARLKATKRNLISRPHLYMLLFLFPSNSATLLATCSCKRVDAVKLDMID